MGITNLSWARLKRYDAFNKDVLELGAQNVYTSDNRYGRIAKDFFKSHTSWDIIEHQGAIKMDLREEIPVAKQYDIVTDFGTLEHVSGNYYQAHKNIHNHCKVGGLIIHENPKTGNWPKHGCNYVDMDFYRKLADLCNYEILELTEEAAMGNTTDGWNISVVLRKLDGSEFISEDKFKTIPVYDK